MAGNNNNSDRDAALLSDGHLIQMMFTFFELNDWKMTCNDMLTKVFGLFNKSIARGCFEETFREFMSCLTDKSLTEFRRNAKDMTYLDFQMVIAGLITRFANHRPLRELMDTNWSITPSNCPAMKFNMHLNSKAFNITGEYIHANVKLVPSGKLTVIDPKQAALLVFIFHTYYSSNSNIDNQTICNFMGTLEQIDEAMHGSIQVGVGDVDYESNSVDTSIKDYLIKKYGEKDVLVKYIMGQYDQIMMMLNCCLLQYDFLNTDPNHQNKKLVENYVAAIMGLPSKPNEFEIWSLYVNELGIVIPYKNISIDGAMSEERVAFIVLTSLMLKDAQSEKDHRPYPEQYSEQSVHVAALMAAQKYSNKNPYNSGVARNPDALGISSDKWAQLKTMSGFLNRKLGLTV
ncbi:U23-like protein [Lissonota sp. PSUC_FEM 10030012]|nr:U23-like protein [Lissonota sp. PSUC_FEM 10030012]